MPSAAAAPTTVHLVTLGCARNEVDSEELAARLADGGFRAGRRPGGRRRGDGEHLRVRRGGQEGLASTRCSPPPTSRSTGRPQAVVAVGCLAERYGTELAEALPEADAVLGFDDYADVAERLQHDPGRRAPQRPRAPGPPQAAAAGPRRPAGGRRSAWPFRVTGSAELPATVAPASGPRTVRRRLDGGPSAPLKIASGCDRRCTFCAIPAFRGAYVSRPPAEIVAEARWLVEQGVREVFLVSENSSSYGKDLGDIRLLETAAAELAAVDGLDWIRVSYLQPAEMRPEPDRGHRRHRRRWCPYFDLSFQHAAPAVLRRMRRFGDPDSFLGLIDSIRAAGARRPASAAT